MEIEVDDFSGVIKDIPPYQLDPKIWSAATNVRVTNKGIERIKGWTSVFGTPPVAPHFAIPLSTPSQIYWLYVSLTKAYVWDGTSHTDVTRATGGNYIAPNTQSWNATIIGGIPILNNGADVPQVWAVPNPGTKLDALSNWPSTLRTATLRNFGPHLIATNITKGGTNYPHLVKWSDAVSDPGTVPGSWDETDPSTDAGEYELPDVNSGILLDQLSLGSQHFLYKEGSVWVMRYLGGRFIFQFDKFLETVGILAPRCVAVTGDGLRQVVALQDDIVVHNGGTPESILDRRMRQTIFDEIDSVTYNTSFMFANPAYKEMWFCYPTSGQTSPNKALVWNYSNNELSEVDGISFNNAAIGSLESGSEELWSDGDDAWEDDTGSWSDLQRRRVILCSPTNVKFYNLDAGLTRDGVEFNAILQREALSIIGRKRSGEWIVDHQIMKFYQKLWPKLRGAPVRFRIGTQQLVDGPITWSDYINFDPAVQMYVDAVGSGRAICLEISSSVSANWRLDGYKLEFTRGGKF